ncbi:MAG: hypothetical protein ABI336_10475 [Humibacillus sp.]
MEFTTELVAMGGTTTGFVVPEEVVAALGAGRRPKVAAMVGVGERAAAADRDEARVALQGEDHRRCSIAR